MLCTSVSLRDHRPASDVHIWNEWNASTCHRLAVRRFGGVRPHPALKVQQNVAGAMFMQEMRGIAELKTQGVARVFASTRFD